MAESSVEFSAWGWQRRVACEVLSSAKLLYPTLDWNEETGFMRGTSYFVVVGPSDSTAYVYNRLRAVFGTDDVKEAEVVEAGGLVQSGGSGQGPTDQIRIEEA